MSGQVERDVLTTREQAVLALVAEGLTNKQIGQRLGITQATAKTHVEHIIAKLGVADRTQAAVLAAELSGHSRPRNNNLPSDLTVQFTSSPDGTPIAYSVVGSGPPLLLFNFSLRAHFQLLWKQVGLREQVHALARRHTLVQLDFRGYGLSSRNVDDKSPETLVADVVTVLDAADLGAVDVCAFGHRASIGIRLAAMHPERVRKMVLAAPLVGNAPNGGIPGLREFMQGSYELWMKMCAQRWCPGLPQHEHNELIQFKRACVEPEYLYAEIEAAGDITVTWLTAHEVRCPTLVTSQPDVDVSEVQDMAKYASAFPDGHFEVLPPGGDALLAAMERFLLS